METQSATATPAPPNLFEGVQLDQFFDQVISRLPEVDEVLRRAGKTRADLVHVARDYEVMSATLSMYAAVVSTPHRLEGGSEKDNAFFAEQIKNHKSSIAWAAINAVLYGTSFFEAVYEEGTPITLKQFSEQSFKYFDVNRRNELRFYPQGRHFSGEVQDQEIKFCVTRWRNTAENPRGESSLAALFWNCFFRKNGDQFWVRYLERHGSGLLNGFTENPAEVQKMANDLAAAINSGVYVTTNGSRVESIKTGDGGQAYSVFDDYFTKRVRLLLLGQTLTSDVGSSGSYAAAKVHKDVADARAMILLDLATQVSNWLIKAIAAVNNMAGELPVCVYEAGEGLALERVKRDCEAAKAGLYKPTDAYMQDYYGLAPGEYTIPTGTVEPAPPNGEKAPAQFSAMGAPAPRFDAQQQAVEDLVDASLSKAAWPISDAELMALVRESTDAQDLAERIDELVRSKTQTAFASTLERALNAADITGYQHMRASA